LTADSVTELEECEVARRATVKANARQEKIAALRAAEARRRRRTLVTACAIGGVIAVILGFVVVKLLTSSSASASAAGLSSSAGSPQVIGKVTGIPAQVFDAVGTGGVQAAPAAIPGDHPLTANGKPKVLYAGAEYCPYCAAERWAVVAALSRFGTFHNLGETASSSSDVFPSTATLSFHGADYSSTYLAFNGYEMQSNKLQGSSYAPLDTLPPADQQLLQTFDAAPYVPSQSAGSIPFIDLGGRYVISGASYDPGVLKGLSHAQIASALSDPSSQVAKSVDGTANLISAALCQLTNAQPATVCQSSGVTTAAKSLPGG
jgi:hypothetical protein